MTTCSGAAWPLWRTPSPIPADTLLVFNPLSWQRSSLVEIDLDNGLELVDLATKQPVPYEVLSTGPEYHHIRFLAQDVPSVGYKAYAHPTVVASAAQFHRDHGRNIGESILPGGSRRRERRHKEHLR